MINLVSKALVERCSPGNNKDDGDAGDGDTEHLMNRNDIELQCIPNLRNRHV